jgi:hypothetical protein
MTSNTMTGRAIVLVSLFGALLTSACGGDSPTSPSAPASSTTFLSLVSSPGDQIGNGFTQRVGLSEGVFSARVSTIFGGRQSVEVNVRPTGNRSDWWWMLRFTMPPGEPLHAGTFENARRWPGEGSQAGLEFSGSGAGCSSSTGRFVITEWVPGQTDIPNRLLMTFEQRCDSASVPIRGEVSIATNPWR